MNQSQALYRSFGLLLALLLFLVGLSLYNFRLLGQANAYSTRSYQTLLESEAVLRALLDMETGVRGYLVTGEEPFLDPYQSGRADFKKHLNAASVLLDEAPKQQARLEELTRLQRKWTETMIEPAIARRRGAQSLEEGLDIASERAGERKIVMDEMRDVIRRIEADEAELLAERTEQVQTRRHWLELILWGGGLFSIGLTATLATFAARAATQIKAAAAKLQATNAELVVARDAAESENAQRRAAQARLREVVEDLERSNAELEQFAYVASHDLQEPLRAVAGCVQVLQKRYQGQLDARADQFIAHAVDGAQRMQNLINDLLAYSRVGTHGKEFEPVSMERVADRALMNLSERIKETGVEVTRDALPELRGDAGQLELVLQNLVSNALKFRGPTEPIVHIGYALNAQDQQHVFSVRDNGLGIEAQYFERIFVMFQRLHTRTEFPGTGIGLAICKKIIERHDGQISVESAPGEGATFTFWIPAGAPAEATAEATAEASETPRETVAA